VPDELDILGILPPLLNAYVIQTQQAVVVSIFLARQIGRSPVIVDTVSPIASAGKAVYIVL
jgi:hypothetical protein